MKAVFVSLVLGVLLCAPIGIARAGDSSVPADPVFRTGFENSSCANGILEDGEQCEDSSAADGDGCSSKCQIEPGFQCTGLPSTCVTLCGNQQFDFGETCDQGAGNIENGDGCSATCQIEHGYNCQGPPPSNCFATCGDGFIGSPAETCDQGFGGNADGDGCSSVCQVEWGWQCSGTPSACTAALCGDGLVAGDEECDNGSANSSLGPCSLTCTWVIP